MRSAVGRLDIEDWLILIGLCAGTAGFGLLATAYGLIFLSAATFGLFLVNVWRAGR